MTKLEKITLIIALTLLIAVLFLIDNSSNNKKLIKDSNNIIKELHKNNKVYTNKIATLQDSIASLQKKDTLIITRYKEKIKYVDTFTRPDYITFYDTLLGTNITATDTFLCFDSVTITTITKRLITGERDSLLLANCNDKINNYDSIIMYKDSLLVNKDTEIANINEVNSLKIKKLRRQRNSFIATTIVELAIIIGLISK